MSGGADAQPRLLGLWSRFRRPRPTVRWRLTLLYGGLFLVCGAALLALTYALVSSQVTAPSRVGINFQDGMPTGVNPTTRLPPPSRSGFNTRPSVTKRPPPVRPCYAPRASNQCLLFTSAPGAAGAYLRLAVTQQRTNDLNELEIWSAIALGVMAIVSGLLGWVVAGRVLRPLRTITATAQDISDANLHRRLALAGPRDELRELADTIDALLERLERAFDGQRRFVANASHELRTPLAMMRTFLDVAVAKPEGVPPQTRALDAGLRGALDQADGLLESFLVLARAEHRELGEQGSVALERLVAAALEDRADQIAANGIDVHTAVEPIRVVGSETLLSRMVGNVLDNAVHHNQARGSIGVALTLDGENARLTVDSDGPALDDQAVAQLAQPFKRIGQDRTGSANGHGLGLSIVAAIAVAHDGVLKLQARPQGGLRVQITLPGVTLAQPAGVNG
jgi:signal transduction histidine kinase